MIEDEPISSETTMFTTLQGKACIAVTIALAATTATATTAEASANESSQRCGELVAKMYKEAWPLGATDDGGMRARYQGHYNASLNRCFLLETLSGLSRSPALKRILPRETQRLSDAYEKKEYGKYDSWGDGPPVTCWLQDRKCNSKQEWARLIKPFLEE